MGEIWFGGTIYTMVEAGNKVDAIYTEDGIIKDTGLFEDLLHSYPEAIRQDLKGNVLYPGFTDSHMHLIGHGEKLRRLDLSNLFSSVQVREALVEKVKDTPEDEWIFGEGWNENNFADRKIFHRQELDEITSSHPMILSRVCRHAVLVNSKALQLAGITKETENPPGGVIVKDINGEPTGYLLDQAQELVKQVIPKATDNYLYQALKTSIQDCVRLGLVGSHSEDLSYYGSFHKTYGAFQNLIVKDGFKYRAHLLVHHEVVDDMHIEGHCYKDSNGFITFGAMKIFADGALGGRTALLSHPYNDAPETSGVAIHTREQLMDLVKKARNYGMAIAVHTIGDLAFEYMLDAIETYPAPEGERDRLIHAQILTKELINRAKKLPLILDIQPRFVATDFPWIIERLGEERLEYSYAWKTLLDEGFICAGGSDAPIEPVDPLLGIHAAVTRQSPGDPLQTVYQPRQCLSMYEAIELFTKGSAMAISEEHKQGVIQKGYYADFTVLNKDLFQISNDDILQTEVIMTVIDGTIMYENMETISLNN
ncbi:amidohydrolase [Sutcliffiella rhizosphaerae]|uniref:N-substituted formamide deformylase n=1 Tax=Sutcliffiella rhizosphaerae TaxID=2880967 RepID=A0ABN8AKA9_9BACI|nr:amidohydrolase [Sutcliffiella rhizosphaerae]CAG9623350.1 N-substituted formamide deformylase [Sutcliffiella rhizosphaerae]